MSLDSIIFCGGLVGGSGGNPFYEANFTPSPSVVKSFTVYQNDSSLCGLLLEYTDGSQKMIANASNDKASITFAPGERINYLGLYGNGVGTRCGGIRITTNKGQTLDHVVNKKNNVYPQDVGSGIMVGVMGRCGSSMDNLGLIFVRPLNSISITIADAEFVNNPVGTSASIGTAVLAQSLIKNPDKESLPWTFNGTQTVTNSRTFTQSATTTWGVSVEVSAGLFDIGVKATTSWQQASETSNASAHTETTTMGTTITGTLQIGESVLCQTICALGTLNLNYTSQVKLVVKDSGYVFEYQENGQFTNSIYAYAQTTTQNNPNTQAAVVEKIAAVVEKLL